MIPSRGETFVAKVYKRIENTNDYEPTPSITFKCRPTEQREKTNFVMTSGLLSQNQGTYITATRLPTEIKNDDRIEYLGKIWLVEAVGYYLINTRMIATDFSNEEIAKRCPKGLKLV